MSRARDLADLGGSADAGGLTGRNLIINGAMNVAQRGTSVLASGSNGFKTVDRFGYTRSGTIPLWDFTQGTSGPNGFSYTFKATLDTAHTLASNSIAYIHSKLEAQDLQHLRYGTSDAKTLTLSFWVKSSNTGTFIIELLHSDASQYQNLAYTITSANTWEYKTLTYVGNTSTAIDNDTGTGLETRFILTAGSDYTGGSLNTGWNATSVSSGRYTGQIDLAATAANYIEITGVQLEVGETATPFEHRSYGDELARCQRYYYKISPGDTGAIGSGINNTTSQSTVLIPYQVEMREGPTAVETSSTANEFDIRKNNTIVLLSSTPTFQAATKYGGEVLCNHAGTTTQGAATLLRTRNTNAYIAWSAEL